MKTPKTRVENIVVQDMNNEILIYDLKDNKAFCLNETSALIYQRCDGKNSVTEIKNSISKELNQSIAEDLIWLALNDLKKENLLEDSKEFEIDFKGLNRRQVIKKVGLASMVILPMVMSVTAPQAAQAGSCLAIGQSCTTLNLVGDCCSGQGVCSEVTHTCIACTPPGGFSEFSINNNCAGVYLSNDCRAVSECEACRNFGGNYCCSGVINFGGACG